jgi:hypothetical protein
MQLGLSMESVVIHSAMEKRWVRGGKGVIVICANLGSVGRELVNERAHDG